MGHIGLAWASYFPLLTNKYRLTKLDHQLGNDDPSCVYHSYPYIALGSSPTTLAVLDALSISFV